MSASSDPPAAPPLVLVHGLFDSPRVFDRLLRALGNGRRPLLIPDLPLRLGVTPVETSADLLARHIEAAFGATRPIDILGFSMGGVIARTWIQLQGGHRRTRRFISVGSPQQGTLTAQPWPRWPLAGVADLKWGSPLLERLNRDLEPLERIECCSFYSGLDLMVVPGWRAVLPVGPRHMLPVWTHPQLLRQAAALDPLVRELLRA
jgi:triacylglycerol lipase